MSKKVILSGYYGFKNFGDEAILSLLINKLREFGCNITVITSNPQYTSSIHAGLNYVKTFDIAGIFGNIIKSDILISGGGSLLQDVTSLKSLFYYLFVILSALIFRKKVIIFAQGIGPINNIFGQIITKNILKHCTYITVRDNKSYELLKKWGIASDIVCDPVFSLPINHNEKQKAVGIQLRDSKNMNDSFLKQLAKAVSTEFRDYNIKILSLQDSIDLEISDKFKQSLLNNNPDLTVSICSDMNSNSVIKEISSCEYLIGMRYHALIIALLAGVKVLPINYDIKVKTLSCQLGLNFLELDDNSINIHDGFKDYNISKINDILNNMKFDWTIIEKFLD